MAAVAACRPAAPGDLADVLDIWAGAFGDAPEAVCDMLSDFVGEGNLYVAGEGRADAILSAVPCHAGGVRGAYFFALATRPEARGRGLMAGLMAGAERRAAEAGLGFACLIPASRSLFDYYGRLGYETLHLRRFSLQLRPGGGAPAALGDAGYLARRERWLPGPAVCFDDARQLLLLREAADLGFGFAGRRGAVMVCGVRAGRLAVAELAARGQAEAEALLNAAAAAAGSHSAELTLAEGSPLFAGQGSLQPAGQVKWLAPGAREALPGLYLRFGMDLVYAKDYESL